MRYQELTEKTETVDGIKVLVNPQKEALINFTDRTEHNFTRGIFDGQDYFFWDANKLIHDAMAPRLGIISYTRLEAFFNRGKLIVDLLDENLPEIQDEKYFQKLKA